MSVPMIPDHRKVAFVNVLAVGYSQFVLTIYLAYMLLGPLAIGKNQFPSLTATQITTRVAAGVLLGGLNEYLYHGNILHTRIPIVKSLFRSIIKDHEIHHGQSGYGENTFATKDPSQLAHVVTHFATFLILFTFNFCLLAPFLALCGFDALSIVLFFEGTLILYCSYEAIHYAMHNSDSWIYQIPWLKGLIEHHKIHHLSWPKLIIHNAVTMPFLELPADWCNSFWKRYIQEKLQ